MEKIHQSVATRLDKLSSAKTVLLQLRLKQQSQLNNRDLIPRRDPGKPAPLSFTQELLWLQHQIAPAHNVPYALRIQGDLDVTALAATLRDIVLRHEMLRTKFVEVDGNPYQIVDEGVTPPLEIIDVQMLPAEEREREISRLIYEHVNRPFDLAVGRLLSTTLLLSGPREHVLILVTHPIASDVWSRDVLFRELSELYDSHRTGRPANLPDLPIQYADYAAWQRDVLQDDVLQKQLDCRMRQLEGAPALLELPTDYPRPSVQTFRGNTIRRPLLTSRELGDLKALGMEAKATLFVTTLAIAKVFLYRHTGQGDVIIGTPIAGRDRAETEHMIGAFVNTLVLRTLISGEMSFREVLQHVRRMTLDAFQYQTLPYVRLFKELNPERSLSYNPIFQVLFAFGQGASAPLTLSDLTVTPFGIDRDKARFDLTISAVEVETGLLGGFEYNANLFTPETIGHMMDRLQNLIKGVVANPDAPIAELPLLSDHERKQMLVEWNNTHVDYPEAATLPALFEAQVERTPGAIALEFSGLKLTYADLNARANQVAHYLRQCGVGPEVPVGILMERSAESIVGLLGILKAGGAYVPLDANYPRERILCILKTTAAPFVVTQRVLEESLSAYKGQILCLDRDENQLSKQSRQNPIHTVGSENLAYIMFTSGSTGEPGGITVPHASLVHYIRAATDIYGLKSTDRVLQFASICCDTSIEESFPCLVIGATLVVRTKEMLDTLATFWQRSRDWRITLLSLPTALWHELARAAVDQSETIPETLRLIVIRGEKARADRLDIWRQHCGQRVQLLNTYGSPETTVVATACDITAPISGQIPIGRPIPNVRVYLLDAFGQLVPRGVTGEMYIGGAGVARGYLQDPERTEERFVPDPFSDRPGARLYRTGDLARWLPDGNLEFRGRGDQQIKIRGFRIELDEIESVLDAHPQVTASAVTAREQGAGDIRLVAYLVIHHDGHEIERELRSYLSTRLPYFMMPSCFVFVDTLPMTPGGKVDRRRLPEPPEETVAEICQEEIPRDDVEVRLIALWKRVLNKSSIGVLDDFFDLGGHSLLAIRLLSEVQKEFDTGISLAEMFKAPTIRDMAHLLRLKEQGEMAWASLVPLQPNGDRPPLFCAPVGGGSAFYYRTLAAHMGMDQPVYTFEPIGMSGLHEPHRTVEEMAAYYIEQMQTVQRQGPYSLCGLSFGAIVAYEMAYQLMEAGEKVANLILFDGKVPGTVKNLNTIRKGSLKYIGRTLHYKVAFHQENLTVCEGMGEQFRYLKSCGARLWKRLQDSRRGTPWSMSRENPISFELPEVFRKVKVAEQKARDAYHPCCYPGRLLLLRARLQSPTIEFDPYLGWDNVAPNIELIETPGTHFSLLEEPCVRVTVAHVHKALEATRDSR